MNFCNPYNPLNNSGMVDVIDVRPEAAEDRQEDNTRLYARLGKVLSSKRVGKGRHKARHCRHSILMHPQIVSSCTRADESFQEAETYKVTFCALCYSVLRCCLSVSVLHVPGLHM